MSKWSCQNFYFLILRSCLIVAECLTDPTAQPLDLPTPSCKNAWHEKIQLFSMKWRKTVRGSTRVHFIFPALTEWKAWFSIYLCGYSVISKELRMDGFWQQQQVAGGGKTPRPNKQGINTKHCWETITWALSVQIRLCFSCTVLHGASLGETVFLSDLN